MAEASPPAWAAHLPPELRWEEVDLLRGRSLPAVIAAWAKQDPDFPVLYEAGTGWLSRGQLQERGGVIAGRFARAGLRAGDRILFSAPASIALVAAHLAALRSGLVVVPANTAYREAELQHILRDAGVRAAVIDRELGSLGGDILALTPDVDLPDGEAAALEELEALDELDRQVPADPAMICYTSGTTGRSKGALLTHGNLLAGAQALRLAWRWTPEDRLVLALPLFHTHGLLVGLHGTLIAGGSAVLLPRFDPETVADAISEQRATLFFGVPTMYTRISASPRAGELRSLRLCVSGSAPLPAELHRKLRDRIGQEVLERYGMTETLMLTSNPYDGERRPGTVGFPLPGVEIRLADGQSGEILVQGPNVFSGYWGRPELQADAFDQGWFRTGDVGALDPDGYFRIVGRDKELIITGGLNVYPREVEDVLLTHPFVAEVAVVGLPSEEWGEEVAAFVVPQHGQSVDAGQLIAFARQHLAKFKCPRRVRLVQSLPRNALGKILRHELR
jgi:malonyl-CoA/methylmalonyl-CoA synthetase